VLSQPRRLAFAPANEIAELMQAMRARDRANNSGTIANIGPPAYEEGHGDVNV